MGDHQIIRLDFQGQIIGLTTNKPEDISLTLDQPVRFEIDQSRVSLFDAETEART